MSLGFIILMLSLVPALLKRSGWFTVLWIIGSLTLGYEYAIVFFGNVTQAYQLQLPGMLGIVPLGMNVLSAFFGMIFALGLPLGMLYGHFYLKQHHSFGISSHLFWLGVMGISMHGLLWMRHSILFLLFWELMSLSSFFCVIQDRSHSLKAGLNYLITMQIGAAFLIAGFAISYLQSGSFDFAQFAGMSRLPLMLLLVGFAFKAGFFPFYSWLPQAHPVAPSHVSGIMSGLMIKTGLYGILVVVSCNQFSLTEVAMFTLICLLSAFLGVIHCLVESNLKRALAYSSIENMGIIGLGLCVGMLGKLTGQPLMQTLGYAGAMLHTLFHSIFKPLLFYLSGNIYCATGTMEIDELGGLNKKLPLTSNLFLLGVLAISALPLGNGFISEFAILYGTYNGLQSSSLPVLLISIIVLAVIAFVGALALIAFTKLYAIIFQGEARSSKATELKTTSSGLLVTPVVLGFLVLLTGVFGNLSLLLINPLMLWLKLDTNVLNNSLTITYTRFTLLFGILIALFGILWFVRKLRVIKLNSPTWGCGYHLPNPRMQYSSMAYIQPLEYFLKPFILILQKREMDEEVFPKSLKYSEEVKDFLFSLIIYPFSKLLDRFFKLFNGIHNGRTNSYIAYSLGFLVILLIWVLGVAK